MPTLYTMVAPCFFGTESTLNFEVKRLGAPLLKPPLGLFGIKTFIGAEDLDVHTYSYLSASYL